MHAEKDKGHGQKVKVLPVDHVPLIALQRLIDVHIGQQAEGENKNPEIYPAKEEHKDDESSYSFMLSDIGLKVEPASSHEDVTGIVNDQDHDSCCNLVAHHRKKDQTRGHKVMEHPFIVFFVVFLNYHQLKYGEYVDAQLEAEVNLQLWSLIRWPIGVLLVDLGARATATDCSRKPILSPECQVGS